MFHAVLTHYYMMQVSILLLVFLVIAGAWLGFWVVRKLVLTNDGSIDSGVSHFVTWSIGIVASVMILQVLVLSIISNTITLFLVSEQFIFDAK